MIPITLSKTGENQVVKRVGGRPDTRKFLKDLGFVEGASVMVVAETCGGVIVRVRDSRIAINRDMANKILV